MPRFNTRNTAGMLALALGGLVVGSTSFAAQPIAHGAPAKATAKAAEGKCGEGKCGDAIFDSIDTNRDAKISLAEFLKVDPTGNATFATKDTNRDGFIDEHESYVSVKAAYNAHGRALPAGLYAHPRLK